MNVESKMPNWRLELTCTAKTGETCRLMGLGPGLAHQESAGQVVGRVWNRTHLFLQFKCGQLASYPDPLLILVQVLKVFIMLSIFMSIVLSALAIEIDCLAQAETGVCSLGIVERFTTTGICGS
jgi:hypothetical protein